MTFTKLNGGISGLVAVVLFNVSYSKLRIIEQI